MAKKRKGKYGGSTRAKNGKKTVLRASTTKQKKRKGAFLVRHFAPKARAPLTKKGSNKPTKHALGAKRWGEPVPKSKSAEARLYQKGKRMLAQARAAKK